MRYLVTGGRGVIGSLFARRMVAEGHSVTIIDDGDDPRHHANSFEGPQYISRRLEHMTTAELAAVLSSCDRVFHAAASTGIPYSATNPLDDWRRNVDGMLALLEALRVEPRPCVVLSSVKPYDVAFLGDDGDVSELFPLAADEIYAASKGAQSLLAQSYARSFDLPIVVFRCSNLYGPACPHGARHGWLTNFAIRAALNWPIEIQGTGEQSRDMLHADDVRSAALFAFAANIENMSGGIFNLGGGPKNVISVRAAYEQLVAFGSSSACVAGPGRKNEDERFVTNCALLRNAGWGRAVPLFDGLRGVYDWACANREMLARVYEAER